MQDSLFDLDRINDFIKETKPEIAQYFEDLINFDISLLSKPPNTPDPSEQI